jgi:thiamine transport system substrate-binding protein
MLTSCSRSSDENSRVTLVAYDSFVLPDGAFDAFTRATGIRVEIALGGDAGELAAKAALTSGNPEGDVLWGVDNTLLSRLTDARSFDPYVSSAAPIDESLVEAGAGIVTPVDFGYVCVNFDIATLRDREVEPPTTLDDLVRPEYRGMLVVPSATMSSPGLAFLLATVSAFPDTWTEYWQQLMDNDLAVADGWTDAYYARFSHHGGDRPLVVSYSTSPAAEVLFADPPLAPGSPAPTGIAAGTCFEQIEFAGVLRGTDESRAARMLIDFLVGREFQGLLPENLFVYPVHAEAELPSSFVDHIEPIDDPWRMEPDEIARRRAELLDEWSRITGS